MCVSKCLVLFIYVKLCSHRASAATAVSASVDVGGGEDLFSYHSCQTSTVALALMVENGFQDDSIEVFTSLC